MNQCWFIRLDIGLSKDDKSKVIMSPNCLIMGKTVVDNILIMRASYTSHAFRNQIFDIDLIPII